MKAAFLTLVFVVAAAWQGLHAQKPVIQPVPSWVTVNAIDYNDKHLDKDAEDGYSDLDYEEQASLAEQATYYRTVRRIITTSGVENGSEVSVTFDPSYSKLFFHTVRILRNGQSINQLNTGRFKMVQQEPELSMHIYNGNVTAILILDDVRRGDVIEYAYTIKGDNPIFKGRYTATFRTSAAVPYYHMLYKIIVPPGRSINTKCIGKYLEPGIQQSATATVYEWKLSDVPAVRLQDKLPAWFNPFNKIDVSEYNSWTDVVNWARELFPENVAPGEGIKSEIRKIEAAASTPEKKTAMALRFVQDEIRYMGIEMGENSHKPHDPNVVFRQRFGDCKDKSYLLTVMLKSMGIDAKPVLINSYRKNELFKYLPSPLVFDHVTVKVRIGGRSYWLDPTISNQRGPLENIEYPDYGAGLPVESGVSAPEQIPNIVKGQTTINETFDVLDMDGRAKLTVKTEYTGSYADNTRDYFANNSRFVIEKDYKTFYAGLFGDIKSDSVEYLDDESSGKVIVTEHYSIPDIWERTGGKKEINLTSYVLDGLIKKPKESKRTMPYEIIYPAKYVEHIELNMPEDWDVTAAEHFTRNPAFEWKVAFSHSGRKITLHYEYESLKDHVLPGEANDCLAGFNSIENDKYFQVSLGNNNDVAIVDPGKATASLKDTSAGTNAIYIILSVLVFILIIVVAVKMK